ncbi:MAG: hypothetical protein M3342_06200 [Bacteroidota bacterium]|nr:hypothetical protein [Bacteroidota bacterium]
MRIVEEEADETMFFLELIAEFFPDQKQEIKTCYLETNEILAMTVSSTNTALSKKQD